MLYLRKDKDTSLDHYKTRASVLKSEVLRYQYTYGKALDKASESGWDHLVDNRTGRPTLLALRQLHPSNRPTDYDDIPTDAKRVNERTLTRFSKPESWRYWDNELPKWYQAWELRQQQRIPSIKETKLEEVYEQRRVSR
ncbi:MAG: hypothetical protein Q9181_008377, partial [Wetmoreana brouardii]